MKGGMGDEGIEHPPLALSKTLISPSDSAPDSAPKGENTPLDPDLARLIEAWSALSDEARAGIRRVAGFDEAKAV